jgi:hypothetical protein
MAESSIFWTTGSTGDGASEYTQEQLFSWLSRSDGEGVVGGYANELACSGIGADISVATGAAVVNGTPYESTAAETVTIPNAVLGTTGHRIVLRKSWAAQTVRIALLSSADGVASIPALTQTIGTTYEISLCSLTRTTAGVSTVVDARSYVRNRLSVNRQGGSATAWGTAGTTNYVSGNVRIQCGSVAGASPTTIVTFPVAFSNTPLIFVKTVTNVPVAELISPTSSAFQVVALDVNGSIVVPTSYEWLAIGPV